MDEKTVAIIVLCFTVLMYAFGGIESKYAYQNYKEQVKELQTRIEICETGWQLDSDLFNLQMCETVCNNKDEQ